MKFVAAKCPNCQGDLQIPDDRDFVKCMYCGGEIKVREVINVASDYSTEVKLWKLDAEKAIKKENYEKALNIYDKILVVNPNNLDILFSKGAIQMFMLFGFETYNLIYPVLKLEEAKDFSSFSLDNDESTNADLKELFDSSIEYFKTVLKKDNNLYKPKVTEVILKCVEHLFEHFHNYEIWLRNINKYGIENAYSNKNEPGVNKEKDLLVDLQKIAGVIGLMEYFLMIVDSEIIKNNIKDLCSLALKGGFYYKYGKKLFDGDDVFKKEVHVFPIYEPLESLFRNCFNKY